MHYALTLLLSGFITMYKIFLLMHVCIESPPLGIMSPGAVVVQDLGVRTVVVEVPDIGILQGVAALVCLQ